LRTCSIQLVFAVSVAYYLMQLVYFETCRLLPESVVWLYANNRVAEAEQIIRDAAKLNNITMPDKILAQPAGTNETVDGGGEKADNDTCKTKDCKLLGKFLNRKKVRRSDEIEDESARYSMLDIFRNRHLTINILCVAYLWSVGLHVGC